MQSDIQEIVIAGGAAAAGAATAAAISLQGSGIGITLLLIPETGDSRSVNVFRGGPQGFHALLGIDESTLFGECSAVHGMGTHYRGLLESEEDVFVPLGTHGKTLRLVDFHHYVSKLRAEDGTQNFNDWSAAAAVADSGRFDPTQSGVEAAFRLLDYDVYADRGQYRDAMEAHASNLGIRVVRQSPIDVELNAAGMLNTVTLADGSTLTGDFFIDCSEDRLLSRHVADDEFLDWSSWIACDRQVSLSAELQETPKPFAVVEAHDGGFVSRLSSLEMSAASMIYSSAETRDEEATEQLAALLTGAESGDAQVASFRPGRYSRHWNKNCVAIGSAAAVLAPFEVSSLQLAHRAILRLLGMLPRTKDSPMLAAEFNRMTHVEIDGARDYQLLRLALAERRTGELWQRVQTTQWPDSLQQRIELFRSRGRFTPRDHEFFTKSNWISSLINFGAWPTSYDPLADMIDEQRMRADLIRFKEMVRAPKA